MKFRLILLLTIVPFLAHAGGVLRFATLFSDNMVMQQQTKAQIWGYSSPNSNLTLTCSWLKNPIILQADGQGRWNAALNTPVASFKEQTIGIADEKGVSIQLKKVLIGEVWLCSGQSNMEMALQDQPDWNLFVEHSAEELSKSTNPKLRFINIQRKESFQPLEEVVSNGWKTGNPSDLKWLSAVGYFFALDLIQELNVPVGLVVSAYGGSPVQSWIPEETTRLSNLYAKEQTIRDAELLASKQTDSEYLASMSNWLSESEKSQNPSWKSNRIPLALPLNLEHSSIGNQMGLFSLSKEIELHSEQMGQPLTVHLGTMDDFGRVYFNGELVWEELRNSKSYRQVHFTVPAEKLKIGMNQIEAKVVNVLWGGGLTGPGSMMYATSGTDTMPMVLTGTWSFEKIFDLKDSKPIPREGKPLFSTLSALYNGMIHPMNGFCFKGCLWYQGEENVHDPLRYPAMMSDMIAAWRSVFQKEMPIYYVQIAPYKYNGVQYSEAAFMREAQASVEKSVIGTHMVSTIDLGDAQNIHPRRKKEVGSRLANLALNETYQRKRHAHFPEVVDVNVKNGMVVLKLRNTYEGLKQVGKAPEFELSQDGMQFVPAETVVQGSTLIVQSPDIRMPAYIRYCWKNASEGTLFNSVGLPLSSFRSILPSVK